MGDTILWKYRILVNACAELVADFQPERILGRCVEAALVITNCEEATLYEADPETNTFVVRAQKNENEKQVRITQVRASDPIVALTHASGRAQHLDGNELMRSTGFLARTMIAVPLAMRETKFGVLTVVNWKKPGVYTEEDQFLLTVLAKYTTLAWKNARLFSQMEHSAMTDHLTGLANRGALDMILEQEAAQSIRYGHPLTLMIIDVDGFKQFNDAHGHIAGDQRLANIAQLLRDHIRTADSAARYGGDEFVIIAPHTMIESAQILAERIRAAAELEAPENSRGNGKSSGYTLSIGLACVSEETCSADDLLRAADAALLQAKAGGGNQVQVVNSSHALADRLVG